MGDWVPKRVRREAEAYVRCGDARSGFVEVSCDDCHQSRVVAFCCKGRGWCPSCTNRRAVETGVRLAALLPWVRHRQWTLSLPFKLRFLVVKRPELLKRLELRLVRAVWRWQRSVARRLGVSGPLSGGAVVFTQWFGSSLQVTPHLHGLVAEALWTPTGELVELPAPDTADVEAILVRVLRGAQRDFVDLEAPWPDDEYEAAQREALQRPLGLELPPSPPRRRVAVGAGFSLHADTAVHGNDRQGLERLCRYGARGPVSKVSPASPGRRAVPVHAEERSHLHVDSRGSGAPPGLPGSAGEGAPDELPWSLRPTCRLAPEGDDASATCSTCAAVTVEEDEEEEGPHDTKTGLGRPSSAHLVSLPTTSPPGALSGVDVLRCPCGGRRRIHAIHSTRKTAEERLLQLGHQLPSRLILPPTPAQPSLPLAG